MPAFPPKTNYAAGDVLTAAQMNDVGNALAAYQFTVGKNKIINGDFRVNQRNFTSTTTHQDYGFDRWQLFAVDGTTTYSTQSFTPGAAPVSGYESANFARLVTTGQTLATAQSRLIQRIEDVRTLAGQTATFSFWAKAASGTPKIALELSQLFGSGGSPSASVDTYGGQVTIGTTWQRYSLTISIPSISGKTIGTTANTSSLSIGIFVSAGSNFNARTGSLGIQSNTFDIWGVQIEAGNVATAFQTATGTLAGELAACQRYYWRSTGGSTYSTYGAGYATLTTEAVFAIKCPTTMRIEPTSIDAGNLGVDFYNVGNIAITALTLNSTGSGMDWVRVVATVASGLTQYRPYDISNANNAAGYIGFSAEL